MFYIKQTDTYTWPVEVRFPKDNGEVGKEIFTATFKRIPQSRIDEIKHMAQTSESMSDRDLACEVLCGWDNIVDEHGQKVPYSESMRDELLDRPMVATAIVLAFTESLSGAKRKN